MSMPCISLPPALAPAPAPAPVPALDLSLPEGIYLENVHLATVIKILGSTLRHPLLRPAPAPYPPLSSQIQLLKGQ
jgi:hypothetical protein